MIWIQTINETGTRPAWHNQTLQSHPRKVALCSANMPGNGIRVLNQVPTVVEITSNKDSFWGIRGFASIAPSIRVRRIVWAPLLS
jgi:hypothetical protein